MRPHTALQLAWMKPDTQPRASLARVNVSLDTLNPRTYKTITDADALEKTVSGIKKAVEVDLNPVKVKMVLLKGLNDHEV